MAKQVWIGSGLSGNRQCWREAEVLRGSIMLWFRMNKADYLDPSLYKRGAHRHTVNLVNSQNVLIQNLTLQSSGGDRCGS